MVFWPLRLGQSRNVTPVIGTTIALLVLVAAADVEEVVGPVVAEAAIGQVVGVAVIVTVAGFWTL